MKRILTTACVALALAAGAIAPFARSQEGRGRPRDASIGESNQRLPQPARISESYPLKGDDERLKSVKGLQQLTVDLLAIVNVYKESHWDVSGSLYLQLHAYYDAQADFYREQADTFAERVLHLGFSVDGRYSTIARTSKIPEMPPGYLSDDESLKLLVERVSVLQKEIYDLLHETEESDPPTSNKLQDLAYFVDKNLWQLRIHVQKPGGLGQDLPWTPQKPR
ncbi:MAG TPA: DNA starvation/stationary phase protection protein [Isosphaeraceae bacterium]